MPQPFAPEFIEQIREAYISGIYPSIKELARQFDVSDQVIIKWRNAGDWDKDREKIRRAADAIIVRRLSGQRADTVVRHREMWDIAYKSLKLAMTKTVKGQVVFRKLTLAGVFRVCQCLEKIQRGQRVNENMEVPTINETSVTRVNINFPGLKPTLQALRDAESAEGTIIDSAPLNGGANGNGKAGSNGKHSSNGNGLPKKLDSGIAEALAHQLEDEDEDEDDDPPEPEPDVKTPAK